jgi:hypothetical protein
MPSRRDFAFYAVVPGSATLSMESVGLARKGRSKFLLDR